MLSLGPGRWLCRNFLFGPALSLEVSALSSVPGGFCRNPRGFRQKPPGTELSAETSSDRAGPKRKFLQSHLPGPKLSIVPPSSSYKKAIPCFRYHQAAARSAFRATTRPPRPKRLRHNSNGETSRCTTLAAQSVAPSIPVPSVCVRARWIQPLSKVDSLSTPCGWYFQAHASSELYLPRRRESDVGCWSHT